MAILRFLTKLFLLPGTLALKSLNITEQDVGGIFRSLVNMIFWGILIVIISMPLIIRYAKAV